MRASLVSCALVGAVCLTLIPAEASAADPSPAEALLKYYKERGASSPVAEAMQQLKSDNESTHAVAAKWVVEVLAQALRDEESGKAPWEALPYWGGGRRNPAQELRASVVKWEGKPPAGAAPILAWFLAHEPDPSLELQAARSLAGIESREADRLRVETLQKSHRTAPVLVSLLEQAAARKLKLAPEKIGDYCEHHRASIRTAARALAKANGLAEPPPFDPVKAMQSPAVVKLEQQIGEAVLEQAPLDARYVVVIYDHFDLMNAKLETYRSYGWVLREEEKSLELLTPFGNRETLEKGEKITAGRDRTVRRTLAAAKVEEDVARLEQIRADKSGESRFALSEQGGLTGQFENSGASYYELTLAQWLFAAKRYDLAARVLLPVLDNLYRDEHAGAIVRRKSGDKAGYQMLVAFVGDRDYAQAEKLARLIMQRFPDTQFSDEAKRLVAQFPQRRDDFTKLKLPTPAEWAEMKKKLSREQQIDFLCQRLRLLNCFQQGQPGGVSMDQEQYAEPCGISENAAWGQGKGKTKVINPYVELGGSFGGFGWGEKSETAVALAVADIPQLTKYLEVDWYVPTVSFWRDFSASRSLHHTRPLVAGLINGLAKKGICDLGEKFDEQAPAEKAKRIEAIAAWGRKNAGRSEADLLIEAAEEDLQAKEDWNEFRFKRLIQLKEKRAWPLLVKHLEATDRWDHRREILDACREFDVAAAQEVAKKYIDDQHGDVRATAALILLAGGDKKRGREVLQKTLESGDRDRITSDAFERSARALLEDKTPESRQAALKLFAHPNLREIFSFGHERGPLFREFAEAKAAEPYQFYLPLLDIGGNQLGRSTYSAPIRNIFAEEICDDFLPNDPVIVKIKKDFPNVPDRIPALKKFLQERIANPEMKEIKPL